MDSLETRLRSIVGTLDMGVNDLLGYSVDTVRGLKIRDGPKGLVRRRRPRSIAAAGVGLCGGGVAKVGASRHETWTTPHFARARSSCPRTIPHPSLGLGPPRRSRMSVDLVRIVDSIHREKNIAKEIVFEGIEAALVTAAKKHYPDAEEIVVSIDRESGDIDAVKDGDQDRPRGARPHRRPDRQAGDDPEDPRGRARQPLRRVRGPAAATWSPAPSSGSRAAPSPSPSARPRRSCPAASRSPARRTTSASASRPSSSTSARSASGSRSSSAAPTPTSSGGCSSTRSPRSPTASSRSGPLAREAGYRTKVAVSSHRLEGRLRRRLRRRPRQPHQEHRRRAGRRADRHRPLERLAAGADPQRPAAGRDRGGHPLPAAGPGDRAGAARTSSRWPSAGAGRTSGWPASWSAGTSRS